MVAPFSGDFLAALNNLPAVALLGFATVGLGEGVGLSRPFRHLCGMAVIGNSIVLHQLTNSDNDVASAALLVACAWLWGAVLATRPDGRRGPLRDRLGAAGWRQVLLARVCRGGVGDGDAPGFRTGPPRGWLPASPA